MLTEHVLSSHKRLEGRKENTPVLYCVATFFPDYRSSQMAFVGPFKTRTPRQVLFSLPSTHSPSLWAIPCWLHACGTLKTWAFPPPIPPGSLLDPSHMRGEWCMHIKSRGRIQISTQIIPVWNTGLFSTGQMQESSCSSSYFTLPDFQSRQIQSCEGYTGSPATSLGKEIKLRPGRIKDPLWIFVSPKVYMLKC